MGFMDRFIGRNEDIEEEYEEEAWEKGGSAARDYERPQASNVRPFGQNVIDFQDVAGARDSIAAAYHMKVVVIEPKSFDDVQEIANCIREKRPVIINIEGTDPEVAKRIIDFASGTAYALNGEIKKVSKAVFLLAPNNVNITIPEDKKGSMDWLRK